MQKVLEAAWRIATLGSVTLCNFTSAFYLKATVVKARKHSASVKALSYYFLLAYTRFISLASPKLMLAVTGECTILFLKL